MALTRRAVLAGLGATALVGCRRKPPVGGPGDLLSTTVASLRARVQAHPEEAQGWHMLLEAAVMAEDHAEAAVCLEALSDLGLEDVWIEDHRAMLAAESQRWQVMLAGSTQPIVDSIVPPPGTDYRMAALYAWHQGDEEAVAALLAEAATWPTSRPGTVDGEPFERLSDADSLLGAFLEVLAPEVYLWLPLDDLLHLRMLERRTPLDELWLPAEVTLRGGGTGQLRIPSRYAGSSRSPEDRVGLGLETRLDVVRGARRGMGRRVLYADAREVDLTTVRELRFD